MGNLHWEKLEMEVGVIAAVCAVVVVVLLWRWQNPGLKPPNLPPRPRKLPILGHFHLLGKLAHRSLANLADQYGPLMYLNLGDVPVLIVSNATMAKEVLNELDLNFASRPELLIRKLLLFDGIKEPNDVALMPYGAVWRYHRKIVTTNLLTKKSIMQFESVRRREMLSALQFILEKSRNGQDINMRLLMETLTSNNIYRMMNNRGHVVARPDFKDQPEGAAIFSTLTAEVLYMAGVFAGGDYIKWLAPLDELFGYSKRVGQLREKLNRFLQSWIDEHRASPAKPGEEDFVDALSALPDERGTGRLPDTAIKAILCDMMFAATDSSSGTVQWALAEIVRHPHVKKRIQDELKAVVGMNRLVNEDDLPKLTYLANVVKESARLHPQAPLLLPHESLQDCKVAGYDVPAKTRVYVNVWKIARDPNSWERPNEFNPDRFQGSSRDMKGQDFEFLPFGAGRRMCPGLNLGMIMATTMLAHMLHTFNLELPPGEIIDIEDEILGLSLSLGKPLKLLAMPRLKLGSSVFDF